ASNASEQVPQLGADGRARAPRGQALRRARDLDILARLRLDRVLARIRQRSCPILPPIGARMADLRSDPAAATAEPRSAGSTRDERPFARPRAGWLVVVVPVLVEFVVGGYRISGPSFWRDEGYTIVGAQRPVGAIFALVQHEDAFHGLYLL